MGTRSNNGEGYIGKMKDGRWTARIQTGFNSQGKPKIKAFYGKTQKEVRQKLKEFQKSELTNTDSSPEYFGDYIKRWYDLFKKNSVKATTYDRNESLLRIHIIPQLGHIHLSSLNIDHLQEFFNYMRDCKLSYDYIRKSRQMIDGCLSYAEAKGDIKKNLVSKVLVLPKSLVEPREIVFLNEEQIVKFVAEATRVFSNGKPVYRYGQGLKLILYTGLRSGEALNLRWNDIDWKNRIIKVSGTVVLIKNRDKKSDSDTNYITVVDTPLKTHNSYRQVTLCESAIEALKAFRDLQQPSDDSEFIFATSTGKVNGKRNLLRTVTSIIRKAEIDVPYFNVHGLRHTFASMLFRRGVDVKTVSALLGHSKVSFTYNRYIHLIEEQKVQALSLLDSM